jgi:hypothetical protein
MLLEKINSASFANGILRLEAAKTNARGEWVENGTIEIPGTLVASIITQMSTAASEISEQLDKSKASNGTGNTESEDESKPKGKGKGKK